MNLFKQFFKKDYSQEAFEAYSLKLPNIIQVRWFRDGKFIIGEIEADGYKFMTQGRNAKEFIEMVNDALFAVYEIPEDYIDLLSKTHKFEPNEQAKSLLMDKSILRSEFGIKKLELAKC